MTYDLIMTEDLLKSIIIGEFIRTFKCEPVDTDVLVNRVANLTDEHDYDCESVRIAVRNLLFEQRYFTLSFSHKLVWIYNPKKEK